MFFLVKCPENSARRCILPIHEKITLPLLNTEFGCTCCGSRLNENSVCGVFANNWYRIIHLYLNFKFIFSRAIESCIAGSWNRIHSFYYFPRVDLIKEGTNFYC